MVLDFTLGRQPVKVEVEVLRDEHGDRTPAVKRLYYYPVVDAVHANLPLDLPVSLLTDEQEDEIECMAIEEEEVAEAWRELADPSSDLSLDLED